MYEQGSNLIDHLSFFLCRHVLFEEKVRNPNDEVLLLQGVEDDLGGTIRVRVLLLAAHRNHLYGNGESEFHCRFPSFHHSLDASSKTLSGMWWVRIRNKTD